MTAAEAATTEDALLGGRVLLRQPAEGFRAATDAVLLAAACPASADEAVLDMGCGAGAALLCLGARVPRLRLHGLEIQQSYLLLAEANAARNGMAVALHLGDVAAPPAAVRAMSFDQVMMNPPFFAQSAPPSPAPDRDMARREGALDVGGWIDAGLRRLRQGGRLTVIHRAERLPDILRALGGRAGDVAVLPLTGRAGRPAGRVIVSARKDSRGPFRLCAPLALHAGARHVRDGDDFSEAAVAVLRDGAPLSF